MTDLCGIYLIRNTVNGKVYVGQSSHIYRRWREHKKAMRLGYKSYLHDAMRKHGLDAFEHVVLELCDFDTMDEREAYWMAVHHCHDESKGYNYRPAGQAKQAMTPEARARISARLKGKKMSPERVEQMRVAALGRPCTEAAKAKIRAFHTGITLDTDTREAIKSAMPAPPKVDAPNKRKLNVEAYRTPEFRAAASERFLGKPKSESARAKHRERMANEPADVKERRLAALRAVTQARWAKWRAEKETQCN
jgi:group I intron endonuclease